MLTDERLAGLWDTAFRYQRAGIAPRYAQFETADVLALLTEVRYLKEWNVTLRDMLERVQWGNTGACPECMGMPPKHAPTCALVAALRGADE